MFSGKSSSLVRVELDMHDSNNVTKVLGQSSTSVQANALADIDADAKCNIIFFNGADY